MEQGPGELSEPLEQMTLRPFWSVVEILGIIAALVPFAITVSSSSMSTENGHITHFVYRDWLAVGGGAVAALCGIGAAARFGGTMRSKRPLRAVVVIGLLGLGAFQILRGLGVVGQPSVATSERAPDPTDDPAYREAVAYARKHPAPPAADRPPVDLAVQLAAILARWQANQIHELYGEVSPNFQKVVNEDDFQMLFARVNAAVGPCGPVIPPIEYALSDGTWTAAAHIQCGKTLMKYSAEFSIVGGVAKADTINVKLATPPKPDPADATAVVRRLLDDLLAARTENFAELFDPRLLRNLGDVAKFGEQLHKIAADAGKLGAITLVTSKADGDTKQAYTYDIAGTEHHLTGTFTAELMMGHWSVIDFNVEPVEPAKKP